MSKNFYGNDDEKSEVDNLACSSDIKRLEKRITELTKKVDKLQKQIDDAAKLKRDIGTKL